MANWEITNDSTTNYLRAQDQTAQNPIDFHEDGTVESSAVNTEESTIAGGKTITQLDVTESEPEVFSPESTVGDFDNRHLPSGSIISTATLYNDANPSMSTTSTSYKEVEQILVDPIEYSPGTVPIVTVNAILKSDTTGEGGNLAINFFRVANGSSGGRSIVQMEVKPLDTSSSSGRYIRKEQMLVKGFNRSATSINHAYPAIGIFLKSTDSAATASIESLNIGVKYEVR